MRPSDIFCYVLFMITLTCATCAAAETEEKEVEETKKNIRLNKRDTIMLIDNFPMETAYQKPKMIYRRVSRISKHRYGPPKPKYGPPRPKYGPPKIMRKPGKKYRGKNASPKYRPQSYKKHTMKPKYGPPKHPNPAYGSPSRTPHFPLHPPVSTDFAEPPTNRDDYPKFNHAEPPVDSYGAFVKTTLKDLYPTLQAFKSMHHFKNDDFAEFDKEYQSWKNLKREQSIDNINEYSKTHPVYMKPEPDVFVTPIPSDGNEENLNSYSDIYAHNEKQKQKVQKEKKKKPGNIKLVNRLWKPQKPDLNEEIIVGGQYAEPPARYIPKFQTNSPLLDDDEFAPPQSYIDSEIPSSATNSPYVNYKNSNLAFSPQNLNDAFSIVD